MLHRQPASRVCSERPGGELRRDPLKTKATQNNVHQMAANGGTSARGP